MNLLRYVAKQERPNAQADTNWQVAMKPGKRRALDKSTPLGEISDQIEKLKASVRAKVEHPFRVIKRQFGHTKVRYRGLKKNSAQLITLFALSNLWMVRRKLQVLDGQVRPPQALASREARNGAPIGLKQVNSGCDRLEICLNC